MERLEFLKNKYPNFKRAYYKRENIEDLQLTNIPFSVATNIPEVCDLNEAIDKLTEYKTNLPQAETIEMLIREYEIRLECTRKETPEEFAIRKEEVEEKDELYDLLTEEREKEVYDDDYNTFLDLSKKFKDGKDFKHYRRTRDIERTNSREENTGEKQVRVPLLQGYGYELGTQPKW